MPFTADEAFDLLSDSRKRDRFAQAYLISGSKGSGKRKLMERLAGLLLGESRDPLKSPDVHLVEPQMKTRVIGVDAIRGLLGELQLSSLLGGVKIAILQDADRMNTEAANALLRTLEEPPGKTHFFLLTEQPEQLLETILSRCIEVPLRSTERPASVRGSRLCWKRCTNFPRRLGRFVRRIQRRPAIHRVTRRG
jgi:DNA polymerase-3 subunit delta'